MGTSNCNPSIAEAEDRQVLGLTYMQNNSKIKKQKCAFKTLPALKAPDCRTLHILKHELSP